MTWRELVRVYLPRVSDRDADYILWNMTAFPFNGLEGVKQQLAELAAVCAPVRKRGWYRKLWREAHRLDEEAMG